MHIARFCSFIILLFSSTGWAQTTGEVSLQEKGWRPEVKARLERLITAESGRHLPVVFDFDNTLICRDIGNATFGVLVKQGTLIPSKIPADLLPTFNLNGRLVSASSAPDLVSYFLDFEQATAHQKSDFTTELVGWGWITQIMQGLTPRHVSFAAQLAYNQGEGLRDLGVYPGESKMVFTDKDAYFRRPFFYPQMVELVGEFLNNDYDVWIISNSPVWAVRWMVTQVLNPALTERGFSKVFNPAHVIGISTLLQGPDQQLSKDPFLVQEDASYAAMNDEALSKYTLTGFLVPPIAGFYGKVAQTLQSIGTRPYFVAGDSFNDFPLLKVGNYKLWISRLERPDYQEGAVVLAKSSPEAGVWMLQPVLADKSPGFVANEEELNKRLPTTDAKVTKSLNILRNSGLLLNFWNTTAPAKPEPTKHDAVPALKK